MKKSQEARLYLRHDGITYSFLSAKLNPGSDGTLLLSMVRAGETDSSVKVSMNLDDGNVLVSEPAVTQKGFRMTYHPSGQINFHQLSAPPIFMEPLSSISSTESLIHVSIPDVRSLDETSKIKKDFAVLDVPTGRLSFTVQITPWNAPDTDQTLLWAWTWHPLFSLRVHSANHLPAEVIQSLPDHFHYMARCLGLFARIPINEEDAKVAFHKALNESEGDVFYPPDGKGECRIVFVVPMRVVPDIKIEFSDPTLTAEIVKITTTEIRYRVLDGKQQLVRDMKAMNIASLVRSAEL